MAGQTRYVPLLPKDQYSNESSIKPGAFGIHDTFRNGMSSVREASRLAHPLEFTERNFHQNSQQRELATLRKTQGLHMPLKLRMERATLSKIQRLPGLQSSRIALRTVLCDDDTLGFEDMFDGSSRELNMLDYNAMFEKEQGLI